eukprot:gene3085-6052_t
MAPFIASQMGYLKSIFVKFSQAVGSRADIVPPTWCVAMSKLQDACPPSSESYVRETIERALLSQNCGSSSLDTDEVINKRRIEDVFESFSVSPIASASIGQVHTATLKTADNKVIPVVVKVQHKDIARIMWADMKTATYLAGIAATFDSKWDIMVVALKSWQTTMSNELDFRIEAKNLEEVGDNLRQSSIDAQVPFPIHTLVTENILVMSRLEGYKVTDNFALDLLQVDKEALLNRIAHCCARQLLVDGVFNADPHAGNLMFVASEKDPQCCCPGLLDFGMTVRLKECSRLAYCKLMIGLFEGDIEVVSAALRDVGYSTNQSDRAPERDAEFFEFLFRDATPRKAALSETMAYFDKRKSQKINDISSGKREKEGRFIASLPDDLIFLARVFGLLRGLTAQLHVSCPILHILALNARIAYGGYSEEVPKRLNSQAFYASPSPSSTSLVGESCYVKGKANFKVFWHIDIGRIYHTFIAELYAALYSLVERKYLVVYRLEICS